MRGVKSRARAIQAEESARRIGAALLEEERVELAYRAACEALECDPIDCILDELVSLTGDRNDLFDAIHAMRTAEQYDRIRSALTLLRDRERDRARLAKAGS